MAGAAHTPGLRAFADTNLRHPPVLQHHTFHGSLPEYQLRLQNPKTPERLLHDHPHHRAGPSLPTDHQRAPSSLSAARPPSAQAPPA